MFYNFVGYGLTPSDERIDYDAVRDLALEHRPKMIVAGATAYPRQIDPQIFRDIADEVGALFMFDAAHIAGLIAAGVHPNPVPVADIVTFTTHKTLRGPRGGTILCREEYAKAIDKAIFPGLGTEGFRLVSGGTDNHLLLVDLRPFDAELTGKVAQASLDAAGITLNKNTVPDDPRSPFVTSGVRIGTPAVTTQGMGTDEMPEIAELIAAVLSAPEDEAVQAEVAERTAALCARFPVYPGLIG